MTVATTADGMPVELFTLADTAGMSVSIATYGATVQRVVFPDREGRPANVVLGYPALEGYLAGNPDFLGGIVGRYANRIGGGSFALGGRRYTLQTNDGRHSLHGGPVGFDKRVWRIVDLTEGAEPSVTLAYLSPDGEMGYPGTLSVLATYHLGGGNALRLDLEATTDRETVVNLASHVYWNLAGEDSGTIESHLLSVPASRYVAVDSELIPTGELVSVAATPLDLREPRVLGEQLRRPSPVLAAAGGLDVTFVLDAPPAGSPALAAALVDPGSGRRLTVLTTEPGLHVYSGQRLAEPHRAFAGLALETQHFPDSPNRPEFPSTVLRPGETYSSTTIWQLSVDA